MPLPRDYLSHNQIRHYIECPQKYRFLYIEGIEVPVNDRILLGSAFHSAVEHCLLQKINGVEVELPSLNEVFLQNLEEMQTGKEVLWKNPRLQTEERGLAFIRIFHSEIAPDIRPMLCEKELMVQIPETEIQLKGIIDLVEEDFCITDFKTASSRWSESKAQNSLQMMIYKYLFDSVYGPVRSQLKYEILFGRTPVSIKRQTLRIPSQEGDIDRMLNIVKHVAQMIIEGNFPRNESYLCNYCDYFLLCKKRKNP